MLSLVFRCTHRDEVSRKRMVTLLVKRIVCILLLINVDTENSLVMMYPVESLFQPHEGQYKPRIHRTIYLNSVSLSLARTGSDW